MRPNGQQPYARHQYALMKHLHALITMIVIFKQCFEALEEEATVIITVSKKNIVTVGLKNIITALG